MDIIIFGLFLVFSLTCIYLFLTDRTNPFLVVAAAIFLVLLGIPLVAGGNLTYSDCEYTISNTTLSDNVTTYNFFHSCTDTPLVWYWKLQEATGVLFMLIGMGLAISFIGSRNKSDD